MKLERSHELWEEGKKYMPSGVSAGGRVNVACGMPHYIDHAEALAFTPLMIRSLLIITAARARQCSATSIRAFRQLLKNASKRAS